MSASSSSAPPKPPVVTFLVPCFNYARYLRACIASIQAQHYDDFEVLILDDASTDETPDLARSLEQEDARIRYFRHEENIGHLNNYNFGLAKARGELIWLISADDLLASDTLLGDYVARFENNPRLGFACCRVQCVDEHSNPYDKYIPRKENTTLPYTPTLFPGHAFFGYLVRGNFVASPGGLVRRACYEQYGFFRPDLPHSGDWYNWLIYSLDWDVYFDPSPRVYYRKHLQNMHMTYEKPRHALENSLLCLNELEKYMRAHGYPKALLQKLTLAKVQFKRKNSFTMSIPEKLFRLYGKLTRQYV